MADMEEMSNPKLDLVVSIAALSAAQSEGKGKGEEEEEGEGASRLTACRPAWQHRQQSAHCRSWEAPSWRIEASLHAHARRSSRQTDRQSAQARKRSGNKNWTEAGGGQPPHFIPPLPWLSSSLCPSASQPLAILHTTSTYLAWLGWPRPCGGGWAWGAVAAQSAHRTTHTY